MYADLESDSKVAVGMFLAESGTLAHWDNLVHHFKHEVQDLQVVELRHIHRMQNSVVDRSAG